MEQEVVTLDIDEINFLYTGIRAILLNSKSIPDFVGKPAPFSMPLVPECLL